MSKDSLRKKIAEQTQEFLEGGGSIKQVPRITFCPAHMGGRGGEAMTFLVGLGTAIKTFSRDLSIWMRAAT